MADTQLSLYLDWFASELKKFRTATDPEVKLVWVRQAKLTLGLIERVLEKEIILTEEEQRRKL